jgi:hypothetical protein
LLNPVDGVLRGAKPRKSGAHTDSSTRIVRAPAL